MELQQTACERCHQTIIIGVEPETPTSPHQWRPGRYRLRVYCDACVSDLAADVRGQRDPADWRRVQRPLKRVAGIRALLCWAQTDD